MIRFRPSRLAALAGACLAVLAAATGPAAAQPAGAPAIHAVTRHEARIGGKVLRYTATVEAATVQEDGAPVAAIVSTAYVADAAPAARPVVFAYNGGPGSSSAFLHMGALGPMRAQFPADLDQPPAPDAPLAPNPYSILDTADLVLIDPPETGFSRDLPGDTKRRYADIFGDAQIVSDFIRDWLAVHGRQSSPVYVLGESYGATRTALVAGDLAAGTPVRLSGIVLLSQMLTVDDLGPRPMNAQGFATALPSMAAVAWSHGRVAAHGRTRDAFLADVRRFAYGDYLPALMLGSQLPPARRARVAATLAADTGLSVRFVLDNDLKVDPETFRRAFDPGRLLGGYDGRYEGPPAQPGAIADPAQRQTTPIIDAAVRRWLREGLGVAETRSYVLQSGKVAAAWSFGDKRRASATTWLSQDMAKQPQARLMIAAGRHDLVTPYATAQYLAGQLPPGRVEVHVYDGGHMFYSVTASLAAFSRDLHAFIVKTSKGS